MDERAFSEKVVHSERRLYRVAKSILRSDADCEDALQEALMRAWMYRATLKNEAYFDTWLIRILINSCKDLQRKNPPVAELPQSLPAPPSPEPELMDALNRLTPKLRLTIVLHYLEGYDISQVASILHIPSGTVKWRLHQGRAALRNLLQEEVGQ